VALDAEVAAVAHADLVDLGEEVVGGVRANTSDRPGSTPIAGRASSPRSSQAVDLAELMLAEQDAHLVERVGGMP
jgi:hypothetical protein